MADRVDILSQHVPIVDDEGRPTAEFMLQWSKQQRVLLTIPDVTTAAKLSALIDLIGGTEGDILRRGVTEWDTLAYSGNVNTFLNGNGAYTQVAEAGLSLSDNTTANATTGRHGLLRKLSGTATEFLAGDGTWATPASGGGGTVTPTVRASNIQSSSNNSYTVSWPTGTVAGDLVLIFCGHGWVASKPAGWTELNNLVGANWNGATFAKQMTSADITAGSVTVTFSGSFNGVLACVSLDGTTIRGIRAPGAYVRNGTGASSSAIDDTGPFVDDTVLMFASNRANSTDTISAGSSLQTVSAASASGCLYELTQVDVLGTHETVSYSTAGTGYYTACIGIAGT